jgi:UDP-3-O-[3-hydroxymyristoyl] N-acetylglucosamine deacetylase
MDMRRRGEMDGLERGATGFGLNGQLHATHGASNELATSTNNHPGLAPRQFTLKAPISCVGIGLHSGRKVSLGLHPAPVGSGIVFRRTDLGIDIPARFDHVVDTRMCTVLADPSRPLARIGTVEHVMAALAGCGVTNALVTVDGPEVPILDGSAASFTFLIDCAGLQAQHADMQVIEVLRSVVVREGEAVAELHPGGDFAGLAATLSIEFAAAAIGRQDLSVDVTPESFRTQLAAARTFTLLHEVEALRQAGLALGGSLDNAVVVDGDHVVNPSGLRMPDEFVRHKLLDAVGDLALAGAALHGRFIGHRTGHTLNNRLLRALFADQANWRLSTDAEVAPRAPSRRAASGRAPSGRAGRQDIRVAVAAAPF